MATLGNAERRVDQMTVLGVRFNLLPDREVVERILMWTDESSSRMVITAGPEFVMMANEDNELKQLTRVADLVTPDGIGIVWAARRRGVVVPGRVTGVELIHTLLRTTASRKQPLRVYILGASEASLQAALQNLRQEYPLHTFAGRNGYFSEGELPGVLSEIAQFEPDLWLVGLGQPRQEKLIYSSLGKLKPCVAVGVGGSIDIWGGTVKRAPRLVQKFNVEWLYRLLSQPSRWRRQLALPRFAWKVLRTPPSLD